MAATSIVSAVSAWFDVGSPQMAVLNTLVAACYMEVILLANAGHHHLSRWVITVTSVAHGAAMCVAYPTGAGFELYLLTAAALPVLVFPRRHRQSLLSVYTLASFALGGVVFFRTHAPSLLSLSHGAMSRAYIINCGFIGLVACGTVMVLQNDYRRARQALSRLRATHKSA